VTLVKTLYLRIEHLVHEVAKFGLVGAIALVVNFSVFNLLRAGLDLQPIRSKVAATVIATVVAYLGNRHWTYADRDRQHWSRESTLFFAFNGVGMIIEAGCLAISHYALDYRGVLADNISGNMVGLALGTLFRFWAYRNWVFPEVAPELEPVRSAPSADAERVGSGSSFDAA
jgi:putative flippase GtrA